MFSTKSCLGSIAWFDIYFSLILTFVYNFNEITFLIVILDNFYLIFSCQSGELI